MTKFNTSRRIRSEINKKKEWFVKRRKEQDELLKKLKSYDLDSLRIYKKFNKPQDELQHFFDHPTKYITSENTEVVELSYYDVSFFEESDRSVLHVGDGIVVKLLKNNNNDMCKYVIYLNHKESCDDSESDGSEIEYSDVDVNDDIMSPVHATKGPIPNNFAMKSLKMYQSMSE